MSLQPPHDNRDVKVYPSAVDPVTEPVPVEPLGPPPRRWNWRALAVIFAIMIPLFIAIYFAWQAFDQTAPSGALPALLASLPTFAA